VVGGVAWVVKGGAILLGLDQPPVLLDLGVACFPVTLTCLAILARRRPSLVLGVLAMASGLVALVAEIAGDELDPAILVSSLALVAGLFLLGGTTLEQRRARALGVATVPALLVGGLLGVWGERLYEVPVVALGLAWLLLGLSLAPTRGSGQALRALRGFGRTTSTGQGA
jgi:hypothetical protein